MGYKITTTRGFITEEFNTIEELNSFITSSIMEASSSLLQANQYLWADTIDIETYLSGSNEIIDESHFRFIYTDSEFENLK
jgi:hypothetical protein